MDYKRIREERRFKVLSFDYNEIMDLLLVPTWHYMKIKRIKLPNDYYVDSVYYEPSARAFNFIVGSEEFRSVSQGMRIPYCDEEIKYAVIELNQDKYLKVLDGDTHA